MSGMKQRTFPKDFLWGASTAAHQVEGGNHNQWTEWEEANAERLARTAKQRLGWLPNWSDIRSAAEDPDNYISGKGVEHYERYQEDFSLLKQLNMNAFRFGIEWARIEPEEGKWDEREIEHYRKYIRELKTLEIEPIPTLWHWTVPVWFAQKGNFEKRQNIKYFERFAAKVVEALGADLRQIIILNEPNAYVYESYLIGEWPPERRNFSLAARVYHNLTLAHKAAYRVIRSARPDMQVAIAMALADRVAYRPRSLANRVVVRTRIYGENWWFLDRIKHQLDVIGVNFYRRFYSDWKLRDHGTAEPLNDMGWYMEPAALQSLLLSVWQRYHKPILVTENGLADGNDAHRKWWLAETMHALRAALQQGADVRGYLHWSLLDNFEWAHGWWPKFGLVAVDRKTMKRSLRPSALWFGEYIRQERGRI